MKDNTRLVYCFYARKSSESDERQAMSIDGQLSGGQPDGGQPDGLSSFKPMYVVEIKKNKSSMTPKIG